VAEIDVEAEQESTVMIGKLMGAFADEQAERGLTESDALRGACRNGEVVLGRERRAFQPGRDDGATGADAAHESVRRNDGHERIPGGPYRATDIGIGRRGGEAKAK